MPTIEITVQLIYNSIDYFFRYYTAFYRIALSM